MNMIEARKKIEERISQGKPQPADPETLELDAIVIMEEVFQHRSNNLIPSRKHVDELTRALRNAKGAPLAPVSVYWIGDGWALVDGHHRHEAYRKHGYSQPVPVSVFKGSLDEAIGEALKGNARDKLPMGRSEKSNAAWRLVVGTDLSISKSIEFSGVSRETIATMRSVKKTLLEQYTAQYLINIGWDSARKLYQDGVLPEKDIDDEWMDKRAKIIADQMTKHLPGDLGRRPDIFWKAIQIFDGRLTDWFMEDLGIDPETREEMSMDGIDF